MIKNVGKRREEREKDAIVAGKWVDE